jgi:hypothetical protein
MPYGKKFTQEERDHVKVVKAEVAKWARENCPDDLNYGAPYSWWRNALEAGQVTQHDYDLARDWYGELWNYRGD